MSQAQEAAQAKPRKPRKVVKSRVQLRIEAGAEIMKTVSRDGTVWSFTDTGRAARADVVERLIMAGVLAPRRDALFADDSQTWGLA
ncbi:MAG: hypothetical protein Q8N10_03420 [Phenylobacterium sp.]|uniref:hypothetical protein n=1 Tax=Phenylobacterium sp. TaxID=1871053 RepID=UPI002726AFC1|nr:hypothetical protein [Phenylobacterium sp.]MDO8912320.1 hypothetical protein [Phenylobacterium sp.]MDP3099532.1 hypothetical protein [Phenylobacterium sp.]